MGNVVTSVTSGGQGGSSARCYTLVNLESTKQQAALTLPFKCCGLESLDKIYYGKGLESLCFCWVPPIIISHRCARVNSLAPVFDYLQYVKTESEGQGDLFTCMTESRQNTTLLPGLSTYHYVTSL